MTSTLRHQRFEPKPATKPKTTNENLTTKRKTSLLSGMSPEARKAMLMIKQDSKDNVTAHVGTGNGLNTKTKPLVSTCRQSDNNNNSDVSKHPVNKNETKESDIPAQQNGGKHTKSEQEVQRFRNVKAFSHATNVTARSRSTLSRTEKTYSEEGHYESGFPFDQTSNDKITTSSLYNTNYEHDDDMNNGNPRVFEYDDERNDGSDDENESKNKEVSSSEQESEIPTSFVLALDRALEENCISRLRGDITDTMRISETGKVRALDGGRLANAQEVVVNVCHEDDKELVFHDDDEESLETAKTISQIRVNIWMEYNANFEHEKDEAAAIDLELCSDPEPRLEAKPERSFLKPPAVTTATPRGREIKTSASKMDFSPRNRSKSVRKDGNNNSTNNNNSNGSYSSAKTKSATTGSITDHSSTRLGSVKSTTDARIPGSKDKIAIRSK
ncbi:GATA zinc finger domain-containing protein 21-like [Physella acuta]|uniref:GATA zinc finger domain-containing protein 21-like n=1 Tax=Physella acuta TaxID=109671 RepID=UPI0027DC1DFE|nr:GATA zinc finger domain-containing protein 21-like [Physella acuta]